MEPYYADESVTLLHGDAVEILRTLPDAAANCVVTSPPYYGLRDYGVADQIGLEQTPVEYVTAPRAVFAEVWRVLADDGTLWLNLGDSYNAYNNNRGPSASISGKADRGRNVCRPGLTVPSLPAKTLLGIPWRVAFSLMDDGWVLRQEIIWAKRNFMPEAVTDRPTGLAATRHGRRYIGIDLNREYLDLSLRTRLAQTALIDGVSE